MEARKKEGWKNERNNKRGKMEIDINRLFDKPKIIAICAERNEGKSNLIYHLISELKNGHKSNIYSYGLKNDLGEIKIFSGGELEEIKNGIIFLDEFFNLFDLDDRKQKKAIENSIRRLFHKNNIIVLCGLPENFKKFISAKIDTFIFKKCRFYDFINGSRIKQVCFAYEGDEKGCYGLGIEKNEALLFDSCHYSKIEVPYYPQFDTKRQNVPLCVPQNVEESVLESVPKNVHEIVREKMCRKNVPKNVPKNILNNTKNNVQTKPKEILNELSVCLIGYDKGVQEVPLEVKGFKEKQDG